MDKPGQASSDSSVRALTSNLVFLLFPTFLLGAGEDGCDGQKPARLNIFYIDLWISIFLELGLAMVAAHLSLSTNRSLPFG